jgi:hypothetical protein
MQVASSSQSEKRSWPGGWLTHVPDAEATRQRPQSWPKLDEPFPREEESPPVAEEDSPATDDEESPTWDEDVAPEWEVPDVAEEDNGSRDDESPREVEASALELEFPLVTTSPAEEEPGMTRSPATHLPFSQISQPRQSVSPLHTPTQRNPSWT